MEESTNLPQEIEGFIDKLVAEKNLGTLDPEVLAQVKGDLASRVEDRINLAILERMPENKLEDFDKVLDTGDAEQIQSFVRQNVLNLEQVIAMALMSFRQAYLGI